MTGGPDLQVVERVCALVARVLRLDAGKIGPETPLIAELGAESIDLLELRFFLEKEFRIRITVAELLQSAGIRTAQEAAIRLTPAAIARALEGRLGPGGAA